MPESGVTFRRAAVDDLPAIVSLLADDGIGQGREDVAHPVAAPYTAAFAAIDADPNQLLAVGEESARVIATLQITFLPGLSRKGSWRGQIEAVRIHRDLRGAGLGQRLFDWAIERCRERNCALVQLTSDKSRSQAHRFYERLGFIASHEGYKLEL